jgi:hypothetical protein
MSKLDVQKARIALQEKMFFVALTVILALLGWSVSNLSTAPAWLLVTSAISLLFAIAFAIKQYLGLLIMIKGLEHVE